MARNIIFLPYMNARLWDRSGQFSRFDVKLYGEASSRTFMEEVRPKLADNAKSPPVEMDSDQEILKLGFCFPFEYSLSFWREVLTKTTFRKFLQNRKQLLTDDGWSHHRFYKIKDQKVM